MSHWTRAGRLGVWLPVIPVQRYIATQLGISCNVPGVQARDALGVAERVWMRMRERGVDLWQADMLATRLGLLPTDLWPEWAELSLAEADAVEAHRDSAPERERARKQRERDRRKQRQVAA